MRIREATILALAELSAEFKLYTAPGQQGGGSMPGLDLEEHLRQERPEVFQTSLESPIVKGWLARPSSYPEEFKTKAIFLWGSMRRFGFGIGVTCLYWDGDRVGVVWGWLGSRWGVSSPALVASS